MEHILIIFSVAIASPAPTPVSQSLKHTYIFLCCSLDPHRPCHIFLHIWHIYSSSSPTLQRCLPPPPRRCCCSWPNRDIVWHDVIYFLMCIFWKCLSEGVFFEQLSHQPKLWKLFVVAELHVPKFRWILMDFKDLKSDKAESCKMYCSGSRVKWGY